jgi:autotransporter translocation and assembly factor TamB
MKLEMDRTDGPTARLTADIGFSLDRFSVDGQVVAEESSKGGVVAVLIGRPDLERMHCASLPRATATAAPWNWFSGAGDRRDFQWGRAVAARGGRHRDLRPAERRRARALVLLVAAFVLLQTPPGLRTLGYLVSSSDITVKGLGGFIPTDLHVERVELRDKDGIWLSLDDAQVRWSFSSLFTGRVRVEEVKAAKIDVVRLPLPTEQAVKSSSSSKFGIPVGVDIDALSVDDLHVGPALGVVDSHWKLAGSGLLTADGSASRFKLDMNRTDGPAAQLAVDLGFSLDRFSVDGTIAATESSKGGVVAALIGRPDLDGMSVKLIAKGDRSQGTAELVSGAGDAVTSNGGIRWQREGNATIVSVNLSLVGPGLPDSPIARLLRSPATLTAEASLDDAGLLLVKQSALRIGPAALDATGRFDTRADKLEATARLTTGDSGPLSDLAAGAKWRNLKLDVQATGSGLAAKPQVTATLKGGADDVILPLPPEQALPPGPVTISARLGLAPDGKLTIDGLDLVTALANVKGGGSYVLATEAADGKITVDLADLALFSKLANMPLRGRGHIELTAAHDKDGQRVSWQGNLDQLALDGIPPGLLQEQLVLSGGAALKRDQAWRLDKVAMQSSGFTFEMSGTGRDRTGVIDMILKLPKLGVLQEDVGGSAEATGKVMMKPTAATCSSPSTWRASAAAVSRRTSSPSSSTPRWRVRRCTAG